jgi:hypothetical protein
VVLNPEAALRLGLIGTGLSNGAIATPLSLAPNTVGNHILNIFADCGWPAGPRPLSGPVPRVWEIDAIKGLPIWWVASIVFRSTFR